MNLDGKKTYIAAGLIGFVTAANTAGFITPEQTQAALGFLASFGLYGLRNAQK